LICIEVNWEARNADEQCCFFLLFIYQHWRIKVDSEKTIRLETSIRIAETFQEKLVSALGDQVQVILFGSQARGEATEESDIDVLVILPETGKRTLDTVLEIAWEVGFEAGRVISVVPATRREMELLASSPFFKTINREGIPV
jgi:predicted nucleotidyltransferase